MLRALIFACCCFALITNGHFQLSCPEKNGRYATSQCDAYIECVNGVAERKLCPDGLLFNANGALFGYPCGYPIDVDCEGRSALQEPQSTENCPRQFGYFRMGDQTHCGQFVNCANGEGFIFNCPEGLAFDERTYKCDWPDQVPSCDAESYLGFACPLNSNSISENDLQLYPHPSDCQRYFVCQNGHPRLQSCGKKRAFNDIYGVCDGIANVTRCANYRFPDDE